MIESITVAQEALANADGSKLDPRERWRRTYAQDMASDDAIYLIAQLLRFTPANRIGPKAGMTHPYCVQFHDEETEIVWSGPDLRDGNAYDDNKKLQTKQYRDRLYELIMSKDTR